MITILFNLETGTAKLAATTAIVLGADVPVRVIFSAAPGSVDALQLALGTDAAPPAVLAYTEDFSEVNATTFDGLLDSSDSRLLAFMAAKGPTPVNVEVVPTLDGVRRPAPHFQLTVQPRIITGPETSDGGPAYYTEGEVDTLVAQRALKTVAAKYRIKSDGTIQLWNADQSLFHTLTITGAAGAETLSIAAGEA